MFLQFFPDFLFPTNEKKNEGKKVGGMICWKN